MAGGRGVRRDQPGCGHGLRGRPVGVRAAARLGGSAFTVAAITGAGEAAALLLRVVSGPLADRTRRYWPLTIWGYALTAVCVPLLGLTPRLGGAGLGVAAALILLERAGKAVRSPAKSALLADAAGRVGMGRGLGVHKALDQVGAFAGPLLVALLLTVRHGGLGLALTALVVPGAAAMVLLGVLRDRTPTSVAGTRAVVPERRAAPPQRLPRTFLALAGGTALCTAGLVTFALIGFHLLRRDLVPTAGVPVLYAAAMAAGALAALVTGEAYDRWGTGVLLALPLLVAGVPGLVFSGGLGLVVPGVLLWGVAVGVQDSTVKALVADLVPRERRATAYGVFAAVQGAGALLGGFATGALYAHSVTGLVCGVGALQAIALALLVPVARTRPRPAVLP